MTIAPDRVERAGILLRVSGLAAGYRGQPVLTNFSLTVEDGDRIALVGPNGCGKSTLLRALTLTLQPDHGMVQFEGRQIEALSTENIVKAGIGYLKQTMNIFPGLTVEENIQLARPVDHSHFSEREKDILKRFIVLDGLMNKRAGLLSGGQRQALAVVMVLMRPPRLLLLDEPIGGLSPNNAQQILASLNAIQNLERFSSIIVEHRLRAIAPWVNRVLLMTKGQIVEDTRDTSILTDRLRLEGHYQL